MQKMFFIKSLTINMLLKIFNKNKQNSTLSLLNQIDK